MLAEEADAHLIAEEIPATERLETENAGRKDGGSLNLGRFRQYQINTRYRQIKTELFVSLLLGAGACAVFWGRAPDSVLLVWISSVITLVGIRSLFIYRPVDDDKPEEILS